jgi:hypothetical protein
MTVREALDQKRIERKFDCKALVLCKQELFYLPKKCNNTSNTVYPVTLEVAQQEAVWFGVSLFEE